MEPAKLPIFKGDKMGNSDTTNMVIQSLPFVGTLLSFLQIDKISSFFYGLFVDPNKPTTADATFSLCCFTLCMVLIMFVYTTLPQMLKNISVATNTAANTVHEFTHIPVNGTIMSESMYHAPVISPDQAQTPPAAPVAPVPSPVNLQASNHQPIYYYKSEPQKIDTRK